MTKETEVNERLQTGCPVLTTAQDRAIHHWKSAHQFRRRTLEEAWECGQALAEVRELMDHGGWRNWLDSVRIAKSTAHRWIKLSEQYQMSQLGTFDSVDAALKAMPPARRKREKPLEPENNESPETGTLPVENTQPAREVEDPHLTADEISEESNTAPSALEQDRATGHRDGDDIDSDDFAVLLGEDPRHVGTAHPQVPADSLPQVQGQDLSPILEEEVPDGGGTPLPGLLKDAHREILRLRRKLHRSKDQKAELQREIDRLRHRLQEKERVRPS